eukprot:2706938-Rhodomonas_salina.3
MVNVDKSASHAASLSKSSAEGPMTSIRAKNPANENPGRWSRMYSPGKRGIVREKLNRTTPALPALSRENVSDERSNPTAGDANTDAGRRPGNVSFPPTLAVIDGSFAINPVLGSETHHCPERSKNSSVPEIEKPGNVMKISPPLPWSVTNVTLKLNCAGDPGNGG